MQPKDQKRLSATVIIVTYNSQDTIFDCLSSLNNQTFQNFDVVLVDNCSTDKTRATIDSYKKIANFTLEIIYLKENTGFACGNNIALKKTSADLIMLLNPDAKADKYWLQHLVATMNQNPEIGICGSKVLTWDGKIIDSAGDIMLSTLRAFKGSEGQSSQDFNSSIFTFGVSAAAAAYRMQMIKEIGFFDEDFFYQCEDVDLCFRCQIAGWKVFSQCEAIIFHRVGHSIKKTYDAGTYYTQRNLEFVRIKNAPLSMLLFFSPQILIGFLVDFAHLCIKKNMYRIFFKAKFDAIKMVPTMIKKRMVIMGKLKKVSNRYLFSLISPVSKEMFLIRFKLKKFQHKGPS